MSYFLSVCICFAPYSMVQVKCECLCIFHRIYCRLASFPYRSSIYLGHGESVPIIGFLLLEIVVTWFWDILLALLTKNLPYFLWIELVAIFARVSGTFRLLLYISLLCDFWRTACKFYFNSCVLYWTGFNSVCFLHIFSSIWLWQNVVQSKIYLAHFRSESPFARPHSI